MGIGIEGGDQLRALAKELRAQGEQGKGLRKELLRGIRETTKGPVTDELKAAALRLLPQRKGLAALAAKNLKVAARSRLTGQSAGVTVLAEIKDMDIAKLETGKLRHPVYGRDRWVNQKIPAGIFGAAVMQTRDGVAKRILAVLDDTAAKIDRSV